MCRKNRPAKTRNKHPIFRQVIVRASDLDGVNSLKSAFSDSNDGHVEDESPPPASATAKG